MPRKKVKEAAAVPTARAVVPAPPPRSTTRKKPAGVQHITRDDIALRAYFIGEKRRREGATGEEREDWIEAERQLRNEQARARRKKSN